MSEAIEFRSAAESDLLAASRLLAAAKLVPLDDSAQFPQGYIVAISGGSIIGLAGVEVHGEDGLLRSVAVDSAWRGRGLGAGLVDNRIEWARRRGLGALYLLTTSAAGFFPRFGFQEIGRDSAPVGIAATLEWSSACPSSARPMKLTLR